jgi:hypothetical protein
MEEKLDDNVVKVETDMTVEDETKKRIDWMEWIIQDLTYRLSKLENENQALKDTLQERDYRLSDIDDRCFGLEAKLLDYNKYVLEMSNDYVRKYTNVMLDAD